MTLLERVNRIAVPIHTGGLLLTLKVSLHEGFWLKIARGGVRSAFLAARSKRSNKKNQWLALDEAPSRPALRITFITAGANFGGFDLLPGHPAALLLCQFCLIIAYQLHPPAPQA